MIIDRKLQVVLEPMFCFHGLNEMRVTYTLGRETYSCVQQFHEDDFRSIFDMLMDQAKNEIATMFMRRLQAQGQEHPAPPPMPPTRYPDGTWTPPTLDGIFAHDPQP